MAMAAPSRPRHAEDRARSRRAVVSSFRELRTGRTSSAAAAQWPSSYAWAARDSGSERLRRPACHSPTAQAVTTSKAAPTGTRRRNRFPWAILDTPAQSLK